MSKLMKVSTSKARCSLLLDRLNRHDAANPSITLRIYSHWVPGTRRVTTAVLDRKENANKIKMEASGEEK